MKLCGLTPTSDTQSVCVVFNGYLGRCVALENVLRLARGLATRPRKKRAESTRSYLYAASAFLGSWGAAPASGSSGLLDHLIIQAVSRINVLALCAVARACKPVL